MGGYLTKTRGGKKGQIRPMIRFCVFFSGTGDSWIPSFRKFNSHFLERLFWTTLIWPLPDAVESEFQAQLKRNHARRASALQHNR